ncbi:MAG: NUDIX hydrolase [SAR86 cluster bacterium]|uniref:Phosphatase NudJ n=1 Tax=SAR86 cluster bacterium TaxID=2030880 RepID=A0A2A5C938_9GAMM|nr:MAG: NUDIX hydrolase [SAR86 cluster bacterium]
MSWHPHTTVACIVEDNGRFLMVEEVDQGQTVFNQPAGHLDENETLYAAALRETLEETAWGVKLDAFLGTYQYLSPNNDVTYIRHCFTASPIKHYPELTLDKDIIAAHWLSAEEILAPDFRARSPIVSKVLQDYLAGQRYPLSLIYHHVAS